jgi:hypothetical protein
MDTTITMAREWAATAAAAAAAAAAVIFFEGARGEGKKRAGREGRRERKEAGDFYLCEVDVKRNTTL